VANPSLDTALAGPAFGYVDFGVAHGLSRETLMTSHVAQTLAASHSAGLRVPSAVSARQPAPAAAAETPL